MEVNKVIQGHCIDKIKEINDNCIDLVYLTLHFLHKRSILFLIEKNTYIYEFNENLIH